MPPLSYTITGKPLAKFPDIVSAALLIKQAQIRAQVRLGFVSPDVRQKVDTLVASAQDNLPEALTSLEMWGNDFSVLLNRLNHWMATEAHVDIQDVSLLDSVNAFSQTIESIVVIRRLKLTMDGNRELIDSLKNKAREFKDELRLTRTHLCESTPGTWGQVFDALAQSLEHALNRVENNQSSFETVLVGSVIGNDWGAPRQYASDVVAELCKVTGLTFVAPPEDNRTTVTDILMGSSRLMELCSDLRILSMVYQRFVHGFFIYGSGPRAGLAEIALPAIAPGSTIMPGKINPSMAMLLEQACQHLAAVDQMAQYSYNEYDFDQSCQSSGAFLMTAESLELLGKASRLFVQKCVEGFTVKPQNNRRHVENALSWIDLVGLLKGKNAQTQVRSLMLSDTLTAKEACLRLGIMDDQEAQSVFDGTALAQSGLSMETLTKYLKKF